MCRTKPICLLIIIVIKSLFTLALRNTSSFVLLAVHGILNILLTNHTSAAYNLLLISLLTSLTIQMP